MVEMEKVQGAMLEPSIVNKTAVRLLSIAVIAVACLFGSKIQGNIAAFLHLISYAINTGSIFWVTFVAGVVMFRNLGRQTFGKVQSKLFPIYFLLSIVTLAIQITTLKHVCRRDYWPAHMLALGVAMASAVINTIMEPWGTGLMFKRYALENAPGDRDIQQIKQLKKTFGMFHGLSSMLNLILLLTCIYHGYLLAGNISV